MKVIMIKQRFVVNNVPISNDNLASACFFIQWVEGRNMLCSLQSSFFNNLCREQNNSMLHFAYCFSSSINYSHKCLTLCPIHNVLSFKVKQMSRPQSLSLSLLLLYFISLLVVRMLNKHHYSNIVVSQINNTFQVKWI